MLPVELPGDLVGAIQIRDRNFIVGTCLRYRDLIRGSTLAAPPLAGELTSRLDYVIHIYQGRLQGSAIVTALDLRRERELNGEFLAPGNKPVGHKPGFAYLEACLMI